MTYAQTIHLRKSEPILKLTLDCWPGAQKGVPTISRRDPKESVTDIEPASIHLPCLIFPSADTLQRPNRLQEQQQRWS